MLGPMVVTLGSVIAGAILALVTTRGHVALGALRTFAVAGVAAAVLVQLLPEAVEQVGPVALLAFVGALVLPQLVARVARLRQRSVSARGLGADLGFYGFALHQWAEGLALGTFVGPGHEGHAHEQIVLSMAAHTVPLTAVFVVATLSSRGRRAALWRTVLLLLATALGFFAAGTISESAIGDALPWLSAAVAGFLCHILLHDEGLSSRRTPLVGALDVLGAAAGVALPWLAAGVHAHEHHEHAPMVREALGEAFVGLALETTPVLLVGLLLGAGLQLLGSRLAPRYLIDGGALQQAWRGIALGAPRPLCACGALPLAEALRRKGAAPALVLAFLVGVPGLGIETLALTVHFLGPGFALVRLAVAVLVAVIVAVVVARLVGVTGPPPRHHETHAQESSVALGGRARGRSALLEVLDELLLHTAPWTLLVLIIAAYVRVTIPSGTLGALAGSGADLIVIALVVLPSYVSAAAAAPLAAVLLVEGISPGAVLAGLVLGPALDLATAGLLLRGYGRRAAVVAVALLWLVSVGAGALVNALGVDAVVPATLGAVARPGLLTWGATAVLGLMLARQVWRWGLHPWFEILDAGGHGHGHAHDEHAHHHHDHGGEHRHHHHQDHEHIPGLPGLELSARSEGERSDVDA